MRRYISIFFLIKLLLLDMIFISHASAQTVNPIIIKASPVSYKITSLADPITIFSNPVSYSIEKTATSVSLTSSPVSFKTDLLPTTVSISSLPVSYVLSMQADLIKLTSNPVSYSLTKFVGMTIKVASNKVSYKVFKGEPVLDSATPNFLPIKKDGTVWEISLKGSNFLSGAIVTIDTTKIAAKYISVNEIKATIPSKYINKANSFDIYVSNPSLHGGVSNGQKITVLEPIPVAKINAIPNIGVSPQIVSFDGSQTDDILARFFDGMLTYSWNFGDALSTDENPNTSNLPNSTHKYLSPGKYIVTLNVTNDYGKVGTLTKEIEIREKNFSPEGIFAASVTNADVPVSISFTSMASDKENDPISYFWDFGDGSTSKEINPSHTYTIPGNYSPVLTLTDSLGAKTSITSTGLKLLPPNNPPMVQVSSIPEKSILKLNKDSRFTAVVKFSNNGTFDPDGEKLIYAWDFGDNETSPEESPTHEYAMSGTYSVKLTVTDERNAKVEKTISIVVEKPAPNPVAILNQTTGNAPFEVVFDGMNSQDFDGMPVTLKWDFGDGNSQLIDSTEGPIKHIYENPGVYLVTLIATSPDNRFKKINPANIIVNENNSPVGQILKIEGDEKGVLGKSKVKLSAKGSLDPASGQIKYKWKWSARSWDLSGNLVDISSAVNDELALNQDLLTTNEEFEYTFTKAGQFIPVLEIEKADGSKFNFYGETYTVSTDQAPVAIAKVTSEEPIVNPGTEIGFDGSESYDLKGLGIKQFIWDFGDGEKSNEIAPKHIFNKEGTFTPTLVVINNEDQIGFAQTSSITVKQIQNGDSISLSRKALFQAVGEEGISDPEKINEAIESMINETAASYVSIDNKKPEIGPIDIEPKSISSGGSLELSALVKDDFGLNSFNYSIYTSNEMLVLQKVIDLSNRVNEDGFNNQVYLQEKIDLPESLIPGTYKIKLSATDSANNEIAKGNSDSNEEISLTFDVKEPEIAKDKIVQSPTKLIFPNIVSDVSSEIQEVLKGRTVSKEYISIKKTKSLKLRTAGFTTKGYISVANPWTVSTASANSLTLGSFNSVDGHIELGAMGTLTPANFANWAYTNVYVDGVFLGTINYNRACGINFDSTNPNPSIYVEFRPTNSKAQELDSKTWAKGTFVFQKNAQTPVLSSITPVENIVSRGSFRIMISGNNFNQTSKILFNGIALNPDVVTSTNLEAIVPASFTSSVGVKPVLVQNADGGKSTSLNFPVKVNPNIPCDLDKTLPKTIYGGEVVTSLDGDDVYTQGIYSVINGVGNISIPFCLDKLLDIKTAIKLSYQPLGSAFNYANIWLDDKNIGVLSLQNSLNSVDTGFFNTSTLSSGEHILKISFSAPVGNKLVVENSTFANASGPVIDKVSPDSIPQQGVTAVTISGKNFDANTKIYFDNVLQKANSLNENQILVTLNSNFNDTNTREIKLEGNGKTANIGLKVRDKVEIVSNSFKIDPAQPFPGNSFKAELLLHDNISSAATYTADFCLTDPDGVLVKIPGVSSLCTADVTVDKNPNSDTKLSTSIPLDIYAKPGNYKLITSVKRNSINGDDYTSFNALTYFADLRINGSASEVSVPVSHKLTFTPRPAVNAIFGIEEDDVENKGFVITGAKVIQDNQSIKYKSVFNVGQDQSPKVRFNFISGDGKESGLTTADNFTFTYKNTNPSATTPLAYQSKLELYWVKNGIQSKIGNVNGPTIYVYPNYKPIAKVRVLSEDFPVYADKPPLITAFVDSGSYDPNQRFSRAVDYVDPKSNKWNLYQLKKGQDENLFTRSQTNISTDGKTFNSGNLIEPGSYFAKLEVSDMTGLSELASTESVTVTSPGQMVIVFATTDPNDKKIYEPTSLSANEPTNGTVGLPVKFKSTIYGSYQSISYKWDFGDGTCTQSPLPADCTASNPTHYYFDRKKSFNGIEFKDRKSVTPKLTATAMFKNGSSETWEALAGTITFNAEPNFVLLDLKPDEPTGIVPFTVNLMIDPVTAKTVNAIPVKYELDWGDGGKEEGEIGRTGEWENKPLQELLAKTFTHTYTAAETYTPKLTIYVKESDRKFEFFVAGIVVGASGIAGDDISGVQDGLTIVKEQGAILNLESEVLKASTKLKPFRWRIVDNAGNVYGEDDYNQYSGANNIFIKYGLKDGNYKLNLSKDTENLSTIDKTFNLNIKDLVKPIIENLEIISGNTISQGQEISFRVDAFDNSELMSINWYLKNEAGNILFNGHKDISGYEVKDIITFSLPNDIAEDDYNLIVEVNDRSNNIVNSLENFDLEISVIDKQYFLENQLLGTVTSGPALFGGVADSFALGGNPIGVGISLVTGIYNLAMILNGSFESTFPELQENEIKDLSNEYKDTVNMSLCREEGRLINNLSMLSDFTSLQNIYLASMFAYQEGSKSQGLLKNFEEDLTNNGDSRFTELNTLASNLTVCPNSNGKLETRTGGDLTKNNPSCFYIPKLIQSTKNSLRMTTSQRANIGLAFLLNSSEVQSIFSLNINDLILKKDKTSKQLKYGYKLLENNFDTNNEVVSAFLNNELGVNKIKDLNEDYKIKSIAYIERLLQDLGSLNTVDGNLSGGENQILETLTPSMTSDITISDVIYLKSLASKSRSTYLGIKSKKTLVSENRISGYDSFVGSFIGVLSTGLQNPLQYKELILLYTKSTPEVIDALIQKNISEEAINFATKESVNQVTKLISTLLPGDRRTNALTDLSQLIQKLRTYSDSKGYKCSELKALEALVESYRFIDETLVVKSESGSLKKIKNKQDYVGILNNTFVSRLNTIKNTIKDKAIEINNQDLASINTLIPRDLVHSILLSKNLTLDQKKQVISYASILIGRSYKKAISNIDAFEHEFLDAKNNIGQVGRLIRKALREIDLLPANSPDIKQQIKKLKILAEVKLVSGEDQSYIFPFQEIAELTTNNKETEVVLSIKNQINSDLNPRSSSNLAGAGRLSILVDKQLAEVKVQTRTVEEILRDVINANFVNKVFEIDGKKVVIVTSSQEDYIVKVEDISNTISEDNSEEDGDSFTLNADDSGRKNLISELQSQSFDENTKNALIQYQILTEQELINPNTFFLGTSKCVRGMSDSGSVESNPNISIPLSVSFDSTGKPTEINLSGKVEAFDAIQGLNGSLHIVYKSTNEEVLSIPLFKLEGSYTLGSVIAIPATKLFGQELDDILSTITGFAAKKGLALKDILPKLTGYITLNGVKIVQGVKIITPAGILLEGYIFNPQPSGENEPKVQVPPQALCLVDKLVAKPGETVMISYSTIDANIVITNLQPGMTNQKAIKDDVITLNPTQDTTFSVSASNSYGNDTAICMVFIDDAPSEIIGKADHQFFYGKDENNLDKSWKYPVTFNIMGSSANNSSFNYSATFSEGEEFTPALRVKPGTYNTSLIVNNIETIKTPDFILAPLESRTVQHMGGVFRHYGTKDSINKIISSSRIIESSQGDIKTLLNTTGLGVYLTNLSLIPTSDLVRGVIAKALRLYTPGSFQYGDPSSIGIIEPERANAFIDLNINSEAVYLDSSLIFPLQFLYSSSFLDFDSSNQHVKLINKYGN